MHIQTRIDDATLLVTFAALEEYGIPADNVADVLRKCVYLVAHSASAQARTRAESYRSKLPQSVQAQKEALADVATVVQQRLNTTTHTRLDEALALMQQQLAESPMTRTEEML
jgi:hypothetical protein